MSYFFLFLMREKGGYMSDRYKKVNIWVQKVPIKPFILEDIHFYAQLRTFYGR